MRYTKVFGAIYALALLNAAVVCRAASETRGKDEKSMGKEAKKIFRELTNIVKEVEDGMEGVSDALAEGGNAESLASSIKSRISKAWVIIRMLDEIGGELRVSALPLMKALQNAGNELNVMLEEGGDTVRMSSDVEKILSAQEERQRKQALTLVQRAEELVAKNEHLNRLALGIGAHGDVESTPDAIVRLIRLKEELLNDNEDGDFAEEYLHAEAPSWSDRSTLQQFLTQRPIMDAATKDMASAMNENVEVAAEDLLRAYASQNATAPSSTGFGGPV